MTDYIEVNRKRWNELVPHHVASDFYDVDGFRAGASTLQKPELDALGDVRGKRLLHLQCHFGLDTLSWARLGAEVTGVDFSDKAIEAATALAREVGIPASFVCCNVLDLDGHLAGDLAGAFDIVFTSYGTVGWLPDVARWAAVVGHFLAPGGRFCMAEFHPVAQTLGRAESGLALVPRYSYFYTPEPDYEELQGSYVDRGLAIENRGNNWWNHSVGDIVNALIGAGLEIRSLVELARSPYDVLEFTEPDGDGGYRLRGGIDSIPLVFVLTATKPASA